MSTSRIFPSGTIGLCFYGFLLAHLCGCASFFPSQAEKNYKFSMKAALMRDWEQRDKIPFSEGSVSKIKMHDSFYNSICQKHSKFETYTIQKDSLLLIDGEGTTTYYCPNEKKYWVSWCGGDPVFYCRNYGPYQFTV